MACGNIAVFHSGMEDGKGILRFAFGHSSFKSMDHEQDMISFLSGSRCLNMRGKLIASGPCPCLLWNTEYVSDDKRI